VRARGGGLLSASALVALGTSVLLVALIGLGLSELGNPPRVGATGSTHAEPAAVVVPAITAQRHVAAGKVPHPSTTTSPSIPVLTPSTATVFPTAPGTAARVPTAAATTTRTATKARSTSTPKAASPTPSPTRGHGNGKGNGNGNGGTRGRHKPAKH
jgi:hypothetical protein